MSQDVRAKVDLRRRLRDLRRGLLPGERDLQARAAARALPTHPLVAPLAPGRVLVPTTYRDELATEAIAARLESAGWTIVRPRADGAHTHIDAIEWRTDRPLAEGYAGIPEPPPEAGPPVPVEALTLVLVPGLAFDTAGGRLGSGLGFFDRFLAPVAAADRPVRIGIGYAQQQVEAVPMQEHDVAMHGLQLGAQTLVCR